MPSAEHSSGESRSASTSARRSPRPRWSTSPRARSSRPPSTATTIDTDVLDGYDACLAELAEQTPARRTPRCWPAPAPAAGCGSRSSATRSWSPPRPAAGSRCRAAARSSTVRRGRPGGTTSTSTGDAPDVVLLTGGTDGGNTEVIVAAAQGLAASGWARPGRGGRQRRRPRRGRRRSSATIPHVLADNVVPRIGVLAPGSARARDPRGVPVPRHRRQAPQQRLAGPTFTAMVRGATPDVVLTGVELLAEPTVGGRAWWSSTSAGPPPTCTRWSRSTRRTAGRRRAGPRGGRARPRSPAPSRATSGCAGPRSPPSRRPGSPDLRRPPGARRDDPGFLPDHRGGARRGRGHRPRRGRPRRSAGTPAAHASWSAPRAGSSSAPAPTCARSAWSSAPAACCGTAAPGVADRVLGASVGRPTTRLAAARARRGSWSTATTCWPRPGCSRPSTRDAAYRLVTTLLEAWID